MNNLITEIKNIPEPLKSLRQWVVWRVEERNGKPTKIPYDPKTGDPAKANDSTSWSSFNKAITTVEEYAELDGIGFEFSKDDPFTGIDLDKCRNPQTGEIEEWALKIIQSLQSYTEISPSGTGVHIIVEGELPQGGNKKGKIEMYDVGRYFTMTGNYIEGTPKTIEDRAEELFLLHRGVFGQPSHPSVDQNGSYSSPATTNLSMSDQELLDKARNAENGQKFSQLFLGDWEGVGYPSQSEADQGFCNMLAFWTGKDPEWMDRLLRQSGLYRSKWDEKHGVQTYGEKTINKAILKITETYAPGKSTQNESEKKDLMFPTEALPSSVERIVREASEALPCPPDFIAIPLLTALGTAIGTKRFIEVKPPDWIEYPLIYSAIVGRPGVIKSPAIFQATQEIRNKQKEYTKEYLQEKTDLEKNQIEYDKDLGDYKKGKKEMPPTPLKTVTRKRTWTADITTEKLANLLHENPHGMMVIRDELTAWVKGMNQYKGGKGSDRQVFLSTWGCAPFTVDRQGKDPIIVDRPFLSVVGCIPPDVLNDIDDDGGREDGFVHRILWSYPESVKIEWTEKTASEEAKKDVHDLFESLFNLEGEKGLRFAPEAKEAWIEFHNDIGMEMQDVGLPIELHGHWAKLKGYCARLALILALCEDPQAEAVNEGAVLGACALVEYFKAHARKVYPLLKKPRREPEEVRCERNILNLFGREKILKKRDAQRRTNYPAFVFNRSWDALLEAERLVEDEKQGKGFWKLS